MFAWGYFPSPEQKPSGEICFWKDFGIAKLTKYTEQKYLGTADLEDRLRPATQTAAATIGLHNQRLSAKTVRSARSMRSYQQPIQADTGNPAPPA